MRVLYARISQRRFEALVREAYQDVSEHRWETEPVEMALVLARLVGYIDRQPELLAGQRLRHNLGKDKVAWLECIYNAYRQKEGTND